MFIFNANCEINIEEFALKTNFGGQKFNGEKNAQFYCTKNFE